MNNLSRRGRVIDTFAARDLKKPERKNFADDIDSYFLERGYGLELRRRRRKKRGTIM